MKLRNKRRWSKGEMSKTVVIYCINVLTAVLIWAMAVKTLSGVFGWALDLSDVLTFTAAAFGGELLLLAFKRVFAKKNDPPDDAAG